MSRINKNWLWDGYARVYDGLLEFWPYQNLINEVSVRADVPPSSRVLDLGCGTGNLLTEVLAVKGVTAVGVDSSAAMLAQAHRKFSAVERDGRLQLVPADLLSYLKSQPSGSFDRVLSLNVFYILHDRQEVWRECLRVMKPSGRLVISTPTVTGSRAIIAEHIRHRGWVGLLKPRLTAVFFWDLLIDVFGRSGDFAFASAETLQAEAVTAGGRVIDPVRTYGGRGQGVNTLFTVVT